MSEDLTLDVESSRTIPEGQHPGRIVDISQRDTRFGPYLDVDIDVLDDSGEDFEVITTLTAGYPAKITTETNLGELLERFGVDLEEADSINLGEILLQEAVIFKTEDESNEDGTFAQIVSESVSPHPEYSREDVWGLSDD